MVSIERMILKQMILDERNHTLSEGLALLPLPDKIRIGFKFYSIPQNLDEYSESICYGQRIYLSEKDTDSNGNEVSNDFASILRFISGYFYPIVNNKPFTSNRAIKFNKVITYLKVAELYPITIHLIKLHSELIEREQKMLHREPSKQEKAAGIDELSIFSELAAIDFLRQSMGRTDNEVMLTPYNDCLVRFYQAKKQNAFNERLTEVYKKEAQYK